MSPRDVYQVGRWSVQSGTRSTLIDWYRDATFVPFSHSLIDSCPRTDDRIRYCTIDGNILSKLHVPENFMHLKPFDEEHTKSLHCPSVPTPFLDMQTSVFKNLSKRNISISQQLPCQPDARKFERNKNKPRVNGRKQKSRFLLDKDNLETKKKPTSVARGIAAQKSNFPIRHFSFNLRWNSLFKYPFVSTTASATTQLSLQNKEYTIKTLTKIPRTRKLQWRRKLVNTLFQALHLYQTKYWSHPA